MLPDYLTYDLDIIFCGTAVGHQSARSRHYYAHPKNKFWRIIHEIDLTTRRLRPDEDHLVIRFGIGLTDLVKGVAGTDKELSKEQFGPSALEEKVLRYRPNVLCFNGKRAAQVYIGRSSVNYGLINETIENTLIFVAPSTSGMANRWWDIKVWHSLSGLINNRAKT